MGDAPHEGLRGAVHLADRDIRRRHGLYVPSLLDKNGRHQTCGLSADGAGVSVTYDLPDGVRIPSWIPTATVPAYSLAKPHRGGRSKLTWQIVRWMRCWAAEHPELSFAEQTAVLMKKYRLSATTIWAVLRNKEWFDPAFTPASVRRGRQLIALPRSTGYWLALPYHWRRVMVSLWFCLLLAQGASRHA